MKALVVDDDRGLADLVSFTLRREGFEVFQAGDGEAAIRRWNDEQPDLIVLDVNLPKLDGFTVCQHIRQRDDVPIVMLTVRGEEDDVVRGLGLGADDYIQKPFSPRQLVARVQVVLRRAGKALVDANHRAGDLTFNPSRREVHIDHGEPIRLTGLESRLLDYLIVNAGRILRYDSIIGYVWGPEGGDRDMLRQLIHRLRTKIEPDQSQPKYIENVPGLGYGLRLYSNS